MYTVKLVACMTSTVGHGMVHSVALSYFSDLDQVLGEENIPSSEEPCKKR